MNTIALKSLFVVLSLTAATAHADWRARDEAPRYGNGQGHPPVYGQGYGMDRHEQGARIREIEERIERQAQRIQRGREEGQLTRWEFRGLMREHRAVRAMQRDFLADGHMNRVEFREMSRALDEAGQRIRIEKHDGETRNHYFDYHASYR